ncbi:hypothetical protein Moror_1095 [Moniliophthora roreri MCA 2997]|uniref:Transmembrane protein n=2 Tax=Moniliophthora roreri TaxID=221103 RepID=V2YNA9_MONRO|nr:hypothetical protein Moror_1095 [Moniliophthora roreri MCA 2997]KAI3598552.1 hypothetical protein WG66_017104 [Moniliophthora roreri]
MPVAPTLPMMYWPTEKPYALLEVTPGDIKIASLAFGWTLGFGYFTTCHAIRETRRTRRINTYVILIWGELIVCLVFAVICWLYLTKDIPPSFWFFFMILTTWALQVQFLLQIIVNRLCILLPSNKKRNWLRWGIAAIITAINISVYNIWIPAKLQISQEYHDINIWWDRCEKIIYLIVDGLLNWYFIHTVKQRLIVHGGLKKYKKLVRFNTQIIWISLSMDALIVGMMSLRNDFVYMQFHPVAYTVKLNIEMAMGNLITKVAKDTGIMLDEDDSNKGMVSNNTHFQTTSMGVQVQVNKQQFTVKDDIELAEPGTGGWATTKENHDLKENLDLKDSPKSSTVDLFPRTEK